jgi:hypothetical protein
MPEFFDAEFTTLGASTVTALDLLACFDTPVVLMFWWLVNGITRL